MFGPDGSLYISNFGFGPPGGQILKGRDQRLIWEMRRVQRKALELLARTQSEGDLRGSIALREVHECLESLGEMLSRERYAGTGRCGECGA